MPIVTDEPIKAAGFPPLPDRFDLPVTTAWARASSAAPGSGSVGGNSGGYSAGPQYDPRPQGVHEHYVHYQAGATIPPSQQQQQTSQQPRSSGYYKCTTPGSDYYNVNTGAQEKEPKLNSRLDAAQQPNAPTPVVVNQSTTQDLSLPDDDFASHAPTTRNSKIKQTANSIGQTATYAIRNAATQASYSMMRFR
jgi:hypothetical protein